MKRFNTTTYFARRAPRYQAALKAFPLARVLDYLPYAAAIAASDIMRFSDIRVCDAFGGNGFLANGFMSSGFSFTVCDSCQEMLEGVKGFPGVHSHVTVDDFKSTLELFGKNHFHAVFAHGGFHHVVEEENGDVDIDASRERQSEIAFRLAEMVSPGGILVLADIPGSEPAEAAESLDQLQLTGSFLTSLLGKEPVKQLSTALGIDFKKGATLATIRDIIERELVKPVDFSVPRRFFDEYIAQNTKMGHVAAYPDFNAFHAAVARSGMVRLGQLNYRGPWLFRSQNEAGWFFREKFSIGEPTSLGCDPKSERQMCSVLDDFLGMRRREGIIAVNWGVTYSVYYRESTL